MELEDLQLIVNGMKSKIITLTAVFVVVMTLSFPLIGAVITRIGLDLLPRGVSLIYLTPMEVLLLKIKLSVMCGLIAALPLLLYYAYKVLAANDMLLDSTKLTRSYVVLLSMIMVMLFLIGASYAYFLMMPLLMNYLYYDAVSSGVVATYSVYEFTYFVVLTVLVFGFVFEMPVVMTLVVRAGIVDARSLRYYRRHSYIGLLILAGLVTGPDVFSLIILALPLIAFYEVSLLVLRFTAPDGGEVKTRAG